MRTIHAVRLMIVMHVVASFAALESCSAPRMRCPGIHASKCRAMIERHELAPGEFSRSSAPVQLEIRDGRKGVWLSTTSFRTVIEADNAKSVEKARDDLRHLFKVIYVDALQERSGMIEYDLSLFAADKEIAGVVKAGRVIRHDRAGEGQRIVFQVEARCLKQMVYAGNGDCR